MKVYLAYSSETTRVANLLPSNEGRQILVDSLIEAYGLHQLCNVFDVEVAELQDLCLFHSQEFVECLLSEYTKNGTHDLNELSDFGLSYDCPVFDGLAEYVQHIAGASLTAANILVSAKKNSSDGRSVVINWYGGRHHGNRDRAAGFCYVNDVVLAILRLRTAFRRIFYLDLDLHHGDGVENAFRYSKNVLTCSIHRHGVGFFPGTGAASSNGTYNIPTERGLSDMKLNQIVQNFILPILEKELPEVIVVQCGADGLASDPHGEWNLTIPGLTKAIMDVVNYKKSTHILLLGGGGYNHRDTARLWCNVTKTIIGVTDEWTEIPIHPELESFAEDHFQFWTDDVLREKPGRRDENGDFIKDTII